MNTFNDNTMTLQIVNPERDEAGNLKNENTNISLQDVEYSIPLILPEKKYEISEEIEKDTSNRIYVLKDTTLTDACNLSHKSYLDTEISPHDLSMKKLSNFNENNVFKCKNCPFLSLSKQNYDTHCLQKHSKQSLTKVKKQIHCPGCLNIFYSKKAFKAHLVYDHQVAQTDLKVFLNDNTKTHKIKEMKNSTTELIKILPKTDKIINDTSNNSFIDDNIDNTVKDLVFTNVNVKLPTILITDINLDQIQIENNVKTESEEQVKTNKKVKSQIGPPIGGTSKPIDPSKEPKVFKCTMNHCNARMKNAHNLEYHLKCHYKSEFLCPECPTNFNVWNSLRGHLWRKHKIDIELYGCDKCDYKTFSLSQLNNIHKRIHTDVKPFLCDICAKAFKNPKQLRTHKAIHKPSYKMCNFVCDICNRPFASRRLLKLHVEGVHQQLKRFLCNYCGYKANSKSAVQLHERKHTGQKPYECEFCDYSTTDHNSLRRHKSKHNGEYSYKCPYCSYACIQSSTFKIHIKSKHPNVENSITFSCKYCNFKSLRKDNYLTHVAKHNLPPTFPLENSVDDPLATSDLQILTRNNKNINVIENALVQPNDTKLDLYTIPLLINSSNKNLFINQSNCVIERLDNSTNTVIEDDVKLTKNKLIVPKQGTDNSKFLFVSTNDFTNNLDSNTFVLDSNLVSNTQSFLVSNLNIPSNCSTNVLPNT